MDKKIGILSIYKEYIFSKLTKNRNFVNLQNFKIVNLQKFVCL